MSFKKKLPEHIPALRRYAYALMNNDPQSVDDLVQDTLERAVLNKNRWQPNSDLRAWLFTIMHNHFVNQYRRQQRAPQLVEMHEHTHNLTGEQNAESALYLRDLENCLNQLNSDQREILVLVIIEGMTYREVAQILSIPAGTVMSRLARAREQIHKQLQQTRKPSLREVK